MFQIALLCTIFAQCVFSTPLPHSLSEWLTNRLTYNSQPLAYVIRLENVDNAFPTFKSKRSIIEGIKTNEQSLLAEIIEQIDSSTTPVRQKRTLESNNSTIRIPRNNNYINPPLSGPKDLHLKANLRYHHQQRHPNGSVSGSYAQMDPSGSLKVTHYVNDDKGFREFPEGNESNGGVDPYQNSPTGNINVVTNSNIGNLPPEIDQHNQNRRGINPLDGNFAPPMNAPYAVAPVDPMTNSPIMHSAQGSVGQFSPRSPLFDKYYRPSQEEVQRTYEYHRMRSAFDPSQYRPNDMTPIPEIPRDKQPELRSVYSEYQMPYQMRYQDPSQGFPPNGPDERQLNSPGAPYAPPPIPLSATSQPQSQLQDVYPQQRLGPVSQSPYPQTLDPQTPVYVQAYDGQQFIPASTYNGPYVSNTATFNQPYPTNIPIYSSPLPQNVATYNHPAPDHIPVYNQAVSQVYPSAQAYQASQAAYPQPPYPSHQVYYTSASNSHPTATATART